MPTEPEPWSDADFRPIEALLRARPLGGRMSRERLNLMRSRLRSRLEAKGFPSFAAFQDRRVPHQGDESGMQLLIDLSTVNHPAFFREEESLEALSDHLVASIRSRLPIAGPLRVWSAGCSAGQEPYSLAMLVAESLPEGPSPNVEIRATDIALGVLRQAAQAIYEPRDLAEVSPSRLRRFFLRGRGARQGTYRVAPEIRRLVTFQLLDLRDPEWPLPDDFDAILCRNVTIYFDEQERPGLLDRLAGRLKPGGWLVVGNCEILPERPGRLEKVAASIFRKVGPP